MSLGITMAPNNPYEQVEAGFLPDLLDYYAHPMKYYVEPFRIYGNLYYVGDENVCMHLIDTGEGLILFDTGYGHATYLLIESIRKCGFDPKDLKYVILSHGHFDHFCGSNDLKDVFGCKVFLSKVDADMIRENPKAALMEYAPVPYAQFPSVDVELEDGDQIALGNTTIRCVSAPGHTDGTMAFFFEAIENGVSKKVGYLGGLGFLSLYKKYLVKYDLDPKMQDKMWDTLYKLTDLPVDITIGNHPYHNGTLEKRKYMIQNPGENPFVDPTVWNEMLMAVKVRLKNFQELGF